jgi:hypothetical protein
MGGGTGLPMFVPLWLLIVLVLGLILDGDLTWLALLVFVVWAIWMAT